LTTMFSQIELNEAARAIISALHKSEKAILHLAEHSPQFRLTSESICAYQIALALIAQAQGAESAPSFTAEECVRAQAAFAAMIARVEKVLPKFAAGTSQHTLAVRRIRAFEIAGQMIQREHTVDLVQQNSFSRIILAAIGKKLEMSDK
jgi:hypothetical protein